MACLHCTSDQAEAILEAIERGNKLRVDQMPDERAAIKVMFAAYDRLRSLGWREIMYAPKDGTIVEVIEAGSAGIFRAHYMTFSKGGGSWWIHDAADLWPADPILFRAIAEQLPTPPTDLAAAASHTER